MKRKLLAAVLIFAMLFTLMPTAAFADNETQTGHIHCVCGAIDTNIGDHTTHSAITFTQWTSTDSMPNTTGNYVLMNNVTLSNNWEPADGTVLCLNGHTLYVNVVDVRQKNLFTLCDCGDGKITTGASTSPEVIYLYADSTFNMYGGVISGGDNKRGVAVTNAWFNMYGGCITGNTTEENGAGVCLNNVAKMAMYGGTIIGNRSTKGTGGGVWSDNTASITIVGDAVISGNTGTDGTNNLHLASDGTTDAKITVGTMGTNASVGVSVDSNHGMVISDGGKDCADNFISDKCNYKVTVVTVEGVESGLGLTARSADDTTQHTFTGPYVQIAGQNQHKIVCGCGNNETIGDCSGGTATCTEKAVCEKCGQPYGEKTPHNYSEATCLVPKTCLVCNVTEGEKDTTNHTSSNFTYTANNDVTHQKVHECCGAEVEAKEACFYGSDNVCDNCGYTNPTPSTSSGSGGFSGTYNYPVVVADTDDEKVTLSDNYAVAGETVTITVTPSSGKQVDEVIVTDEDGEVITVTKVGDNTYTFTMPKGKVNVAVTTEAIDYDNKIVLQIGNKNVVVNGKPLANDVAPLLQGDRTLVPIRVIIEALGGSVDWNEATRTVTIYLDGKVLTLVIDEPIPGFGQGATIMDNRTYVPIRYVAEYVGAHVEWTAESQQIVILK